MINKKKLKRELLEQNRVFHDIKIAILSGVSLGELPDLLEINLLKIGIRPEFFKGDYNRYYEDALYSEELVKFKPDVVYIYTTRHNIINFPDISETTDEAKTTLEKEFSRWRGVWEACKERLSCLVIQNNFDYPTERPLGGLDGIDPRGKVAYVNALNACFAAYAMEQSGFLLLDIAYLSASEGLHKWYDPAYMYLYKYAVSVPSTEVLADSLAHMLASVYGKRKKCIVLDLDNTLWGGVIGEVGYEHVQVGMETPAGEAFTHFQRYIKEISETGVLLCVASKNDESAAKSGFNAHGMVLKEEDFVCFYANWGPKHESIKKMAEELNLGIDSFVFIDDNPAERELVRNMLPEVAVIEASKPDEFITAIEVSGYFETVSLSAEDRKRTQMYKDNQARRREEASYENYGDYLKSLDMKCYIAPVSEKNIERATQLIEKTNQFNLTAKRYTEAEMTDFANSADGVTVCARLTDKFGDNGIVSVCVCRFEDGALRICSWVMSCRVFSRHLEYVVFDELVKKCVEKRMTRILGEFRQTAKNKPSSGLFGELGFTQINEDNGVQQWEYEIPEAYTAKNAVMEVVYE